MNHRSLMSISAAALAIVFTAVLLTPAASGQHVVKAGAAAVSIANDKSAGKAYVVKKTPDGAPDLQGYWTNNTYTPLERPNGVTKEFYTPAEAAEVAKKGAERDAGQLEATPGTVGDVHYDFTQFGLNKAQTDLTADLRTSMITDPANGKIPPYTAEAQKRLGGQRGGRGGGGGTNYDSVKGIPIGSRCIYQGAGPPMLPPGYNPGYQIVQGKDYVMILIEAGHEVRVIPTNGRPHPPEGVREWLGDSVGHWDGNTLVVETTNFNNRVNFRNATPNLKVTEKFTRTGDKTILYQFTINDPSTWETPWTAELPFTAIDGPIFEHACTEGNYGIANTLAGVRAQEKKAAETAAKKGGQ